ncbi:uncharacterized protein [Rutidosis leptorrhynchoides]|uniref:uncharacterized protein n=1 Tax=Rutidosis leptorrhynchoides TaxID=125765 RepID=UPI003A98E08A
MNAASLNRLVDQLGLIVLHDNLDSWEWTVALPTRSNLYKRGMEIDDIGCITCNCLMKMVDHIFFECPLALDLWSKIRGWVDLNIPISPSWASWFDWYNNMRLTADAKIKLYVIVGATLWHIWRFRNSVLYGSPRLKKDILFDSIRNFSFNWIVSRSKCNCSWNSWLVKPL